MAEKQNTVIGGAIGNCVHVAGVYEFLRIAENIGFSTKFLGAAVAIPDFVAEISKTKPSIVCISYRLTPTSLTGILQEFFKEIDKQNLFNRKFFFGGTPSNVEIARDFSQFTHFFTGEEPYEEILKSLETDISTKSKKIISEKSSVYTSNNLETKAESKRDSYILPMIRHHFGLPSLEETIAGVKKIAESKMVDVISLATDQNAQEFFFEPEKMDKNLDGTGGVPVRSEADLERIFAASRYGNNPRLRIYSGTKNLEKWAEMSLRTINNAWGTIPLFWYSQLDGRSKRPLDEAIEENKKVIKWYAEREIPVEINDSHHWSLRESPDVMAVVDFYISALNAKDLGVKKYIAQMMFNTPRLSSAKMDLAKMLAKMELANELVDDNFEIWKQVRAGLTHFSVDLDVAKGQLAASTLLSLALDPQIIHVVSFSEASHAASSENVIESCKIVKGVLKNTWRGFPDLTIDPEVKQRKEFLLSEAREMIKLMRTAFSNNAEDPLTNSKILAKIVNHGFLDAPQLKGNPAALGKIRTMPVNGGYDIVNKNGMPVKISEYFAELMEAKSFKKLKDGK
ncbi:MAG: cobalamin B12-binding domain-containing protein [Bacteroidales bacterium]|nr:cobalamin B12-binding domain-containing protein [Bacteroidales bacterium]